MPNSTDIDVTDKRLYENGKLLGGKSNGFVPLGLNVKDLQLMQMTSVKLCKNFRCW